MSREAFHLLLEKYLQNRCTDEEKEIVEKWYGLLDKQEGKAPAATEINELEQKLWDRINEDVVADEPEKVVHPTQPAIKRFPVFRVAAAAVIAGFVLIAGYQFFLAENNKSDFIVPANASLVKQYKNNGLKPVEIKLEDGSQVVLQPKATLKYPEHFLKDRREVTLEGEGFFQISKNPSRPFLVYNRNVVTRVLGTSFTVKAGSDVYETEVIVRTGKVVVSPSTEGGGFDARNPLSPTNGVVLTPNQKTVYNAAKNTFATSLVEQPIPIDLDKDRTAVKDDCSFNDTPVAEVLDQLQKTYGIAFVVEDKELYNYTFTGDLSGQNLYNQLDFLCESIKARYQIKGTKIIISVKE
uniref:FecR family protein n=1 Tax=Pedobacter schmidteae TaxID=2201271 RepID=UPI000EB15F38|nr:FecR family protein [Pedobacter schmidteae]